MNKIKSILTLLVLTTAFFACRDNITNDVFNHEAQAIIDDDRLNDFFRSYYFDVEIDSLKPLIEGKTSLLDDPKLNELDVRFDNIDYKLYTYVKEEGIGINKPTIADSVLVRRSELFITDSLEIRTVVTARLQTWIDPFRRVSSSGNTSSIQLEREGWVKGIVAFKEGIQLQTNNAPITFAGVGRGFIFIPSGLAFRNTGLGNTIPGNSNFIYDIDLFKVNVGTDHDNDGVATIDEDGDGDGDPRNDMNDRNNRGIPDYLNPNRPE